MFLLTAVVLVFGFVLLSASPDYPLVASAAPSRQASQSQPGGAQELQSGQKQSAATAQSGRAQHAQQKVGGPTAAGAAVSGGERTVQDDKNTIQSVGRVLDNDEEDFLREEFIEYDTNGDGKYSARRLPQSIISRTAMETALKTTEN